jgi:hypothetical protein
MTAQAKAVELINRYILIGLSIDEAKDCAKIAVEEIIAAIPTQPSSSETERIEAVTFWVEVKEQI